jgi:ADP-ribose pyrophosphatase
MNPSLPKEAEIAFQSELFTIYTWPQRLYDGSTKTFECCIRPSAVVIMGFLDSETILLTKQEQPHRDRPFFDLAGGRIEPGEDPETAARREFLEETGYEIGRLEPWFTDTQQGVIRFSQFFFWATDLRQTPEKQQLDSGERIALIPTSRTDFRDHCLNDTLRNRITALAWLRLCENPEAQNRLRTFLR